MIALPRFVDPNLEPKDREEQMRERSVARAQSVAAMSTRDASVFQSKGWDALFQAAQDLNSLKTVLEEEEPAVTQPSSDSIRVDESTKKATKQAKAPKRRTHVSHFYSLLDETPEETKAREKRMRERRETLLALHTEERKKWMSSRGRVVRPELDPAMKLQLQQAFDLIDQDGSGAIDVDELEEAFKVLGIKASRRQVEEMMDEVDEDKSGEVELPEFEQIMTKQLMADPDEKSKSSSGMGAVPFHVIATSYRRKRLLDAILSGDRQATESMIEKAEAYRELEELNQEILRGEYFWITTKVAFMIRGWIRRWKARQKQKHLDRLEEMRALGIEDEDAVPATLFLHEKGERDMGLKMNAREMDGRTMEKIRLRAKLGSIVHALSAHDQLEMHSNTTNHQHERHDMLSIKGNLRSVINSTIAEHGKGLQKRMLLAATAHNRMRAQETRRSSFMPPPEIEYQLAPSDIRGDVDLSPRGREVAAAADRLSQLPARNASRRLSSTLQLAVNRNSVRTSRLTMKPVLPPVTGEVPPPRSQSCIPFSSPSGAKGIGESTKQDEMDDRLARNESRSARLRRLEEAGREKSKEALQAMAREKDRQWMAHASSKALSTVEQLQHSASQEPPDVSAPPMLEASSELRAGRDAAEGGQENGRAAEEEQGTSAEDDEVRRVMEGAGERHGHGVRREAGVRWQQAPTHATRSPDVRVTMRYRSVYQHSMDQAAGSDGRMGTHLRSSPTPTSLTSCFPAAVHRSPDTYKGEASDAPPASRTPLGSVSLPSINRTKANKLDGDRNHHQRSPQARHSLQLGALVRPKHAGPTNGVRPTTWRSSRSPAAHSPTPAIYPTYMPSKASQQAVRSISPGPARQFLMVMRQSMPRTPSVQVHGPPHGLDFGNIF